jgi:hypothetical protein
MGCSGSIAGDPEILELTAKIKAALMAKKKLQYQISQVRFLNSLSHLNPEVKDMKDAQIQNLRLAKDVKDVQTLRAMVIDREISEKQLEELEKARENLKKMLAERETDIEKLAEDTVVEAFSLKESQEVLTTLQIEQQKVNERLDGLMMSEKYRTISSMEETLEHLGYDLEAAINEMRSPDLSPGRRKTITLTRCHQQLMLELKRNSELLDTISELKAKNFEKNAFLGEELAEEMALLESQEKEMLRLISEAESLKKAQSDSKA